MSDDLKIKLTFVCREYDNLMTQQSFTRSQLEGLTEIEVAGYPYQIKTNGNVWQQFQRLVKDKKHASIQDLNDLVEYVAFPITPPDGKEYNGE